MKHKLTICLILALAGLFGSSAFAAIQFSINLAPPPIVVYDQPPCPADGYLWAPGYYQYGDYGYFWVPGHWVLPPSPGLLWTPGYWGFETGLYRWHAGYWGPTVGFYGGINYGFGYFGVGFTGGRWEGRVFRYNTAVMHVDERVVHNTYVDRAAIRNVQVQNHAFNGQGGITAQASREEREAERAPHQGPTKVQQSHAEEAHANHRAAHGGERR